jgi:tetratricopeptide (TPR) repeat protein
MSIRSLLLLAALSAALAPRSAAAQGPASPSAGASASSADVERARQLHLEGLAHYEKRQYGRAINAYRKAYALVPAPGILFNLAQAYRLRGDCKRAYRAYKNFLEVVTDTPEANLAREHAQALRSCAKAPAEPEPAPAPAIAPAPVLAPELTDETSAPPPPVVEPVVTIERSPRSQAGQNKKIVGLGIGGAGGALALVGVYYGFKARGAASDLSDFYDEGGAWTDELAQREDDLDRNRALALGFGLAGAAAIGTGAVLYWLGYQESSIERADQGAVAVVPGAGGAVVTWSGAF